tara:strand:- start:56 stop:412 length:357 start_codon:yes stop_codon:yes gene_type:complete
MKFGRLDRRVRFKKPVGTQDLYGAPTPTWENLSATDAAIGLVWAEVIWPGSPKESPQAHQIFPERHITFIIRDPRGSWVIDNDYRAEYEAEDYDVIGWQEIGRRVGLRVFCRRVNDGA